MFCQLFSSPSASILRALITQEPIELEASHFCQKFFIITSSQLFRSNIIVLVPSLQQTLKQKICYLNNWSFDQKEPLLVINHHFCFMLLRGNCVVFKPYCFSSLKLLLFEHQCCWDTEDWMLFKRWAILYLQ